MDLATNILLGILESVIGGIILVAGAAFFSEKARWVLTATLGRVLQIDTEYVFNNSDQAAPDMIKELERAKAVKILSGRGGEIQRRTFEPILGKSQTDRDIRILLPVSKSASVDWVAQREAELAKIDPAFGSGLLSKQITNTVDFLEPHIKAQKVALKFFDMPHLGRIVLTDRCAYFTPYRNDAHGRDTHVIKYKRGGDMYDWLERLFNELWDNA